MTLSHLVTSLFLLVPDPNDDIYRKAALDHYLTAQEFGAITRVSPPWTWALLLLAIALVCTALLFSIFTRIEVTSRAPGILTTSVRAVSFLSERNRSLTRRDDIVRLELAQFPYTEFGTVRGSIDRVDHKPASASEIRAALGENARIADPVYRVEIAILPDSSSGKEPIPLRAGMRADVRYTVRRDRPILVLFAPLRRWLD